MPLRVTEVEVMLVTEPVVTVGTTDTEEEEEEEGGGSVCSVLVLLEVVDDFLNLAVTVIDLFIFTTQVPVPLQLPPLQPEKE